MKNNQIIAMRFTLLIISLVIPLFFYIYFRSISIFVMIFSIVIFYMAIKFLNTALEVNSLGKRIGKVLAGLSVTTDDCKRVMSIFNALDLEKQRQMEGVLYGCYSEYTGKLHKQTMRTEATQKILGIALSYNESN